jgi:cell filamentation protein
LDALTKELWNPNKGILDNYFAPLIYPADRRLGWRERILAVQGLDGAYAPEQNIAYESDDPNGVARYNEMKRARERSV